MYKVPPHILLKARMADQYALVQPPGTVDKPRGRRGGASKYYLILLKMKEEETRRQSHAV
jgi:hypothetical protein